MVNKTPIPVVVSNASELKAWRKALSISMDNASKLLGLSIMAYWNYENKKRNIPDPVRLSCTYIEGLQYANSGFLASVSIERKKRA